MFGTVTQGTGTRDRAGHKAEGTTRIAQSKGDGSAKSTAKQDKAAQRGRTKQQIRENQDEARQSRILNQDTKARQVRTTKQGNKAEQSRTTKQDEAE